MFGTDKSSRVGQLTCEANGFVLNPPDESFVSGVGLPAAAEARTAQVPEALRPSVTWATWLRLSVVIESDSVDGCFLCIVMLMNC